MKILDFARVSMMTQFMILGIDHIFTIGFESDGKWLSKRGFFKNDIEIAKQLIVTYEDTTGGSHPLVILELNHFPEDYYEDDDTDDLMKTDTYILDQLEKRIKNMKQLIRYNQILKEDKKNMKQLVKYNQSYKKDKKNENTGVDDMIKRIRDIDEMTNSVVYDITNDNRLMNLLFDSWEDIKSRRREDEQYSVMLVCLRDIVSRLVDGRYGYKLVKVDEDE